MAQFCSFAGRLPTRHCSCRAQPKRRDNQEIAASKQKPNEAITLTNLNPPPPTPQPFSKMVSDAKPAALPDDGTLPSPQGPGLLSPSDWRVLPTWFHLATGTYFVTNSIMVWTMSQIAPSPLAAGLGIGGLFVGFVEVSRRTGEEVETRSR